MSQFDYQESYDRNLPHIQPPGATLFVTFRLHEENLLLLQGEVVQVAC